MPSALTNAEFFLKIIICLICKFACHFQIFITIYFHLFLTAPGSQQGRSETCTQKVSIAWKNSYFFHNNKMKAKYKFKMKTISLYPIILKHSLMKKMRKRLSDCSYMKSNHYWFKGGIHRNDLAWQKKLSKLDAKNKMCCYSIWGKMQWSARPQQVTGHRNWSGKNTVVKTIIMSFERLNFGFLMLMEFPSLRLPLQTSSLQKKQIGKIRVILCLVLLWRNPGRCSRGMGTASSFPVFS